MAKKPAKVSSTFRSRKAYFICTSCGHIGLGRDTMPGHRATELLLWILLFFPGPVYSAWRHMNRTLVCSKCGHNDIIPVDTPQGDTLFNQQMRSE